MHIPDNYLSPATCAAMVPVWTVAVRKVTRKVDRELERPSRFSS